MSTGNTKKKNGFIPPPIPHEKELKEVVEEIKNMTPEELFQASVEAGIHNPDGSLTAPYTDISNAPVT